jgi:hypothetical protein
MATYTLTTLYKKSSEERSFWFKDGQTAIRSEGYRWGTFTKESDEVPDIDLNNPHGFEPYGDEWELVSLDDGCWGDWEWPEGLPAEERERLETLWGEEWYEGLEGEGWSQDETEVWLFGPLMLKNEDTDQEWRGDDGRQDSDTVLPPEVVNIVNHDSPVSADYDPEVTAWFPADINPVHLGEYEVITGVGAVSWPFPTDSTRATWTGPGWEINGSAVDTVSKWRGLANNPRGKNNGN